MAKVGDTVRYLNSVGGGRITRIDGKMAYVEEDGFETPMLLKDLVVVMPAGYESDKSGAKLMFDQKAYETGRKSAEPQLSKEIAAPGAVAAAPPKPEPVEETSHGDSLSIALAFEPSDVKHLDKSSFNVVLVNDSNYYLSFAFLSRADDAREWQLVYQDTVAPNELMDLAQYTHDTLGSIGRVALQAIAFKRDKGFELKPAINVTRRLDLTKFYKLHCFRPGIYFDTPVIEIKLVDADKATAAPDPKVLITTPKDNTAQLAEKFRIDRRGDKGRGKKSNPADNPNKLLPLIEVDLHIGELTDTTAGMSNHDMLTMQLDTVTKTMDAHKRRIGQKIVFIHGKGDGVLRKAVLDLLKRKYPTAELQDASFREYGFGATLVTIHQ